MEKVEAKKLCGVSKKKSGRNAMTAENVKKSRKSTEKIKLNFFAIRSILIKQGK